jgi:hypothetical protein
MVYSHRYTPSRRGVTAASASLIFSLIFSGVFRGGVRLDLPLRQRLGSDHQRAGSHAERFGEREQQHVVGIELPGLERLDAALSDSGRGRELALAQAALLTQLADRLAEKSQIVGFPCALRQRKLSQIAL